jgi:hypothetical protein
MKARPTGPLGPPAAPRASGVTENVPPASSAIAKPATSGSNSISFTSSETLPRGTPVLGLGSGMILS